MALEAVVSSLDSVDESLREHYTEVPDVGFVLQTNEFVNDKVSYGNVDTAKLKGALKSERSNSKAAQSKLSALSAFEEFSELGIDGIKSAIDFKENYDGKVNSDIEAIKSQYDAKLSEANKLAEDRLNNFLNAKKTADLTSAINGRVNDLVDNQGARDFLMSKLSNSTKVDESGNIVVVDAAGVALQTRSLDSAENMSVSEFLDMTLSDPSNAFILKPSGAQGSGSTGSSGGGQAGSKLTVDAFSKMNGIEKTELKANNPQEYDKLYNEWLGSI